MSRRTLTRLAWLLPLAVVCILIAIFPVLTSNQYYQNMVIISLVIAVGASGLNIITGFAGYPSLAHGAFLGVGAYTVAILSVKVGGNPFYWIVLGGVVAAFLADTPDAGDLTPALSGAWPTRPAGSGPGYLVQSGEADMDGFYYACLGKRP